MGGLSVRHETLSLALRDPFRIARTAADEEAQRITTVIVEVRHQDYPDLVGLGEGYPDRFYGETPETMATVFELLLDRLERKPFEPAGHWLVWAHGLMGSAIRGHGAAKCAIDIALHDLVGRILGIPVHQLLDLSPEIPPTDFTIGIDEPAVVAERARRAGDYPALKIKCGGPADLEIAQHLDHGFGA